MSGPPRTATTVECSTRPAIDAPARWSVSSSLGSRFVSRPGRIPRTAAPEARNCTPWSIQGASRSERRTPATPSAPSRSRLGAQALEHRATAARERLSLDSEPRTPPLEIRTFFSPGWMPRRRTQNAGTGGPGRRLRARARGLRSRTPSRERRREIDGRLLVASLQLRLRAAAPARRGRAPCGRPRRRAPVTRRSIHSSSGEVLVLQRDPADDLAPPARDMPAVVVELVAVVAETDHEPPHPLAAEAAAALDFDALRERTLELRRERFDERLQVGRVGTERGSETRSKSGPSDTRRGGASASRTAEPCGPCAGRPSCAPRCARRASGSPRA